MILKKIINVITKQCALYNDYRKLPFLRKINYYINNNFFTNQNRVYRKYFIGDYTYGKPEILFDSGSCWLIIGKYCSIWSWTKIFLWGNHRSDRVSTYPFHQIEDIAWYEKTWIVWNGDVVIGNDVWIGMDVTIMSWVTIGDGAVIAYGSLVTKDVQPYTIVGWVPSKEIRKRFTDNQIEQLLKIQWWQYDEQYLKTRIPLLLSNDVESFTKSFSAYE